MKHQDLIGILNAGNKNDWTYDDESGTYTYKQDMNLCIKASKLDFEADKFEGEDWATRHPDKTAYRQEYTVNYSNAVVHRNTLVRVDGLRATLPMPKIGTNQVNQECYAFAKIVDNHNTLNEYMRRADLVVVNS
jgi:hypothetical protein